METALRRRNLSNNFIYLDVKIVTLWEALQGQPPFAGTTADAIGLAALREELRPPATSAVPVAVEAVLRRGLRAQPEQRHASVQALGEALRRAIEAPTERGRGWLARWRGG